MKTWHSENNLFVSVAYLGGGWERIGCGNGFKIWGTQLALLLSPDIGQNNCEELLCN